MLSHLHFARSVVLLISIIVLSACSSGSKTAPVIDPGPTLREQLQTVVDDAVESGLPGVSLYVQRKGESISVVAGVANQDTAEPVTPSSLFHAASIGKTFTATLLIRLIDMGFLRLDDPIDIFLDPSMSSMISDSGRITVEMLLANTSGIPDYYDNAEFVTAFIESSGRIWTPIELLGYIDSAQNHFEPGADYSYSNTNYVLLGVIAERVTSLSLGMALRQWVFEPAGLVNTFGVFENLGQPMTVRGYIPASFLNIDPPTVGSGIDSTELLNSEGLGDASIHSIPSDLNSFIRTLIDTDTLVSGDLQTKMMTESFPGVSEHGLGLFVSNEGPTTFGSTGKGFGVHSAMLYFPAEDLSFATIVNGSFGDYDELYDQYTAQLTSVLGIGE